MLEVAVGTELARWCGCGFGCVGPLLQTPESEELEPCEFARVTGAIGGPIARAMDARRKRLIYRSNYRGFKEADLLLGGFAKAHMHAMTDEEVAQFEDLLEAKDHDIYDWISGKVPVPANYDTPILARLRNFDPVQHLKG